MTKISPFALFLSIAYLGVTIFSQNPTSTVINNKSLHRSKLWTSSDGRFSVEVPVSLEPSNEYSDKSDPNAIATYYGKLEGFGFLAMSVRYSDVQGKNRKDKFGGLFFVIGGDDDHAFNEKTVKNDGLTSKEIVYRNQNSKGRFIDAGDTVFILGLNVKNRKDLDSVIANRFFSSFRWNRNVKVKRNIPTPVTKDFSNGDPPALRKP